MPEITLTQDQASLIERTHGVVLVRDPNGRVVGRIEPELSAELIAELKRRAAAPGPRYSGAQVQARLQALQAEWDRTGGFDEKRLCELLAELNAADPGSPSRRQT